MYNVQFNVPDGRWSDYSNGGGDYNLQVRCSDDMVFLLVFSFVRHGLLSFKGVFLHFVKRRFTFRNETEPFKPTYTETEGTEHRTESS